MQSNTKTIGIIGGGQLGMMLTQAAHNLGFRVAILEKSLNCPAYSILDLNKDKFILGQLSDIDKLKKLADFSDVLTFEIEHIDTEVLTQLELETSKKVLPSLKILATINDKFLQKNFLKKAELPVGKYEPIRSLKNFDKLIRQFGFPFLIKARKGGYDGGGNFVVKSKKELELLIINLDLGKTHEKYFVEKFVPFEQEIAVLLAKNIYGNVVIYPIIDTFQENNVCSKTIVPSNLELIIQEKAKSIGKEVVNKLNYVGIIAIEMFVLADGKILINEIAPRVHNSGHWTLNGSVTNQFEQHVRCITGLELGSVENKQSTTLMYNIFGSNYNLIEKLQKKPIKSVTTYNYSKKEIRPNRKMGHVNIVGENRDEIEKLLINKIL